MSENRQKLSKGGIWGFHRDFLKIFENLSGSFGFSVFEIFKSL